MNATNDPETPHEVLEAIDGLIQAEAERLSGGRLDVALMGLGALNRIRAVAGAIVEAAEKRRK